jgi:hypothetical protein
LDSVCGRQTPEILGRSHASRRSLVNGRRRKGSLAHVQSPRLPSWTGIARSAQAAQIDPTHRWFAATHWSRRMGNVRFESCVQRDIDAVLHRDAWRREGSRRRASKSGPTPPRSASPGGVVFFEKRRRGERREETDVDAFGGTFEFRRVQRVQTSRPIQSHAASWAHPFQARIRREHTGHATVVAQTRPPTQSQVASSVPCRIVRKFSAKTKFSSGKRWPDRFWSRWLKTNSTLPSGVQPGAA